MNTSAYWREYRDELQEELTEVNAEIERMKTVKEEKD